LVPRYYNGVRFSRTTISCGALTIVMALFYQAASADVTFPLEEKWNAALGAPPSFAPAFDTTRVYIPLNNNQLVAVWLKDGTRAWSVECPMSAAPVAGDGMVFSGTDGLIEARSQTDGLVQWRRPIEGRITSLYWDTGWLLATTASGPLLALRGIDGEILWQGDVGAPLHAPPAPAGDRLYLALKDGHLLALSIETGEQIWTQKLPEAGVGILALADRLYVGGLDNYFYSLDTRDGRVKWKWPTGADVLGMPALDPRRVYFVALDNVLRAHNRNSGSMMWKRVLPMRPSTGPLLSGNTVIVAGVATELHAYNAADGRPAGDFILKGAQGEELQLAAPPHVTAEDLVILTTKGGRLRALGNAPRDPATPSPAGPATTPPPP
jgi:outer membrane protein assembly factor BamB